MDYSARRLTAFDVWGVSSNREHAHEYFGTVEMQFSAQDETNYGPKITVELGVTVPANTSFEIVETSLLVAALDLLKRAASETPDQVKALLHPPSKDANNQSQ